MASMATGVLTDYLEAAMRQAILERLPAGPNYGDGQWYASIPDCPGTWGLGATQDEALRDLRGSLEEWVLLGLRTSQELPAIEGISLAVSPQ